MEKIFDCIPVILAAGKGTRMHSSRPKVLHTLLGQPMLDYVIKAVKDVFFLPPVIITGYRAAEIEAAFPGERYVRQEDLNGTGGALQQAMPSLEKTDAEYLFVINGDTPLVTPRIIRNFIMESRSADITFASVILADPGAFGRVVRFNGQLAGIVEAKDYDESRLGKPSGEINSGLYYLNRKAAGELLPELANTNMAGEVYLTDLISQGIKAGLSVQAIPCDATINLLGINSPVELVRAEESLARQTAEQLLNDGVIIHSPAMARINPQVRIAAGAEIFTPCEIYGNTMIEKDVIIDSCCYIKDSIIEEGARLKSFSHIESAQIGKNAVAGPYVRLRPGAVLKESSHAGNFVELKKAVLGAGAKANHLSYLGDADIGENVNIGAGTITCNYDGLNKHRTKIGAGSFIGSNTALVAPVSVGENALVGAGSVITHNVPDNELAIARSRQKNIVRRKE